MIGNYVRHLREQNGYLLRQMAALLDVDTTILSKMERGERTFKKENILKIAEICDTNKDELISLWLANKICDVIKGEDLAINAIELAKKQKENEQSKNM